MYVPLYIYIYFYVTGWSASLIYTICTVHIVQLLVVAKTALHMLNRTSIQVIVCFAFRSIPFLEASQQRELKRSWYSSSITNNLKGWKVYVASLLD
jgi:hypothetical protein